MARKALEFIVTPSGCHECTSHYTNRDGYPCSKVKRKNRAIIRHLYENAHGKIGDGLLVRHTCDNRLCINILHAILGTDTENVSDRKQRDRSARGTNHGRSKLNWEKVAEIRSSDEPTAVLAARFGVDPKAIRQVRKFETWVLTVTG